jgi:hypothetical protein
MGTTVLMGYSVHKHGLHVKCTYISQFTVPVLVSLCTAGVWQNPHLENEGDGKGHWVLHPRSWEQRCSILFQPPLMKIVTNEDTVLNKR